MQKLLSPRNSALAVALFAAAIAASALNLMPLLKSLAILMFLFIVLGFFRFEDIRANSNFDIIVLVGSALGVSKVMLDSGASTLIAHGILFFFKDYGAFANLASIYFLTMLLTQLVTNNAAAALAFPWPIPRRSPCRPIPYRSSWPLRAGSPAFPHPATGSRLI